MSEKPPIDTAAIVAAMKREITADIEAGIVPSTITDFSELHDYVDANVYADEELLKYEETTGQEWLDYINGVQDEVHQWLKDGRPNVPSIEDQGYDPNHDDWRYC